MFTVERIGISVYNRTDGDKCLQYTGWGLVFTVERIGISVYSRPDSDLCLQ